MGDSMVIEKDREIWVGESRFYLDEDNTLYMSMVGEIDEKMALETTEAILKFDNLSKGEKRNVLVDVNKARNVSSEARKIFKGLTEDGKTKKVALFGLHPVARVIASFVMGVSRNKDMRFFKAKEEAIAWLEE